MESIPNELLSGLSAADLPSPYNTIAESMGVEIAIQFAELFGRSGMYFPDLIRRLRPIRDNKIREEFNGENHKELARKYQLSERWIYKILESKEK